MVAAATAVRRARLLVCLCPCAALAAGVVPLPERQRPPPFKDSLRVDWYGSSIDDDDKDGRAGASSRSVVFAVIGLFRMSAA